jgi:hypothetical protein
MEKLPKIKFMMDTDWMFKGTVDSEHKEYILLNYFQKLNNSLEEMKLYPMFTELSLHLGNIQSLLSHHKILYTDKKLVSPDEEILITDLKYKDIPEMTDEQRIEFQKILKMAQPKLLDYFNIVKAFWSVVYDSIDIVTRKNKDNINSKKGFFFYVKGEEVYFWEYTIRKVKNSEYVTKSTIKLLYRESKEKLTISEVLSRFDNEEKVIKYPVFEMVCNDMFPFEETLIPLFKRKLMSQINQRSKKFKTTNIKNYGIQ